MPDVDIFVPAAGSRLRLTIDPASAIISTGQRDGRQMIWFEGNRYGMAGLEVFANRVHGAADRALTYYPTIARAQVDPGELTRVGVWDRERGEVRLNDARAKALLAEWLDVPTIAPEQLLADSHRFSMRRDIERLAGFG